METVEEVPEEPTGTESSERKGASGTQEVDNSTNEAQVLDIGKAG